MDLYQKYLLENGEIIQELMCVLFNANFDATFLFLQLIIKL